MNNKTANLLALALTAVGLLLGPGYLGYCWYLSGSTVETQQLSETQPLTLRLAPEMNPIRFVIAATFNHEGHTDKIFGYRAVLAQDAQTIWEEPFSFTQPKKTRDKKNEGFRISPRSATLQSPLRTFFVDEANDFTLTVRSNPHRMASPGVHLLLHVRRNVTVPSFAIVIPGFLVALVGAGFWLATKQQRSAHNRSVPSARPKP